MDQFGICDHKDQSFEQNHDEKTVNHGKQDILACLQFHSDSSIPWSKKEACLCLF